ncbi:MAG: hypothetical protein AB7I37_25110 [Pirellulales bacterium]
MCEDVPLKMPRSWCGLLAVAMWLAAAPVWGQRTQFPTTTPSASPFDRVQPAPAVTLDDRILPPGGWDPYDTTTQPAIPQTLDAYGADPTGQPNYNPFEQAIYGGPANQRLIQQIKAEFTYLGKTGTAAAFQTQDLEFSLTAAFPFFYNVAPLLVTPGFNFHFWSGPGTVATNLPPRVYDAYLDFGWRPQVTPWFSLDLGVRPGLYTDFAFLSNRSFRVQARALGIFTVSPEVQIVAGVLYINRYNIKLLPAGGIIWTPNEDARYEILFPRPKLSQRITTFGNTDWWVYLAGEYGGGAWTVERDDPAGGGGTIRDAVEYDDFRVAVGLEWFACSGTKGYFEVGYVFNRQLYYLSDRPHRLDLNTTYMLRAGIIF